MICYGVRFPVPVLWPFSRFPPLLHQIFVECHLCTWPWVRHQDSSGQLQLMWPLIWPSIEATGEFADVNKWWNPKAWDRVEKYKMIWKHKEVAYINQESEKNPVQNKSSLRPGWREEARQREKKTSRQKEEPKKLLTQVGLREKWGAMRLEMNMNHRLGIGWSLIIGQAWTLLRVLLDNSCEPGQHSVQPLRITEGL